MSNSIQPAQSQGGALSAEHYESYELAKEYDGILGGSDIAQIRSYAAHARAQAQVLHKEIAASRSVDDVATIKSETVETAQTFAKVGLYADQRIGEILREMPKASAGRKSNNSDASEEFTKANALKDAGIARSQAYDLEALAANPEVVQAVIDKAEADGRIVSRAQVLKAIKERDEAREEIAALEKQNDQLYEQAQAATEPKVVERQVVPESVRREIDSLKSDNKRLSREYQEMWRKKRELDEKLNQANELLGENERKRGVRRDIEQLTIATNTYLRNYGGRAWAFDQFDRVDKPTQEEFCKAIANLAAFAQNLYQMVQEITAEGKTNE